MAITKAVVVDSAFNPNLSLPYELRAIDFKVAMLDVYDFLHDVNCLLVDKGLQRFDDMVRPAMMSGLLSDMLTASMGRHARTLVPNRHFGGHPDLVVEGVYPDDTILSGTKGVEIKSTKKKGGAVDTHGAREQWMCVFVYETDSHTQPAVDRKATAFTEIYMAKVFKSDFRRNERNVLGTRTATLHREGVKKLREGWVYRI